MANIYPPSYPQHPQIPFQPGRVSHAPSSLTFGFGLGGHASSFSPSSSPAPVAPSLFAPQHSHAIPRPQKRRHDGEGSDDAMDRSPTPERPKRGPPKRVRVAEAQTPQQRQESGSPPSEEKQSSSEVDVGVLLASLPTQSLLPLMTSLIREKPELKPLLLSLIPRPTLEVALQALASASKNLRDAYPYSSSFGFGGAAEPRGSSSSTGTMRNSYIVSRLRPQISAFLSTCMTYLPYFSCAPSPPTPSASSRINPQAMMKPSPAEIFTFLSTVTSHILSQPQLTQSELSSLLTPRLLREWEAWVNRVDEVVNREGGMFSGEAVRTWMRDLDEFADKAGDGLKAVRDTFVAKAGWLIGRRPVAMMDDEEL